MRRIVYAGLVLLGSCTFAPSGGASVDDDPAADAMPAPGVDAGRLDGSGPGGDAGVLGLNVACDPRRSACDPTWLICRPREDGSGEGLCRPPGPRAAGEACQVEGDDCAAGLACAADAPTSLIGRCAPVCDVAAPACPPGLACHPWWTEWVGVCG